MTWTSSRSMTYLDCAGFLISIISSFLKLNNSMYLSKRFLTSKFELCQVTLISLFPKNEAQRAKKSSSTLNSFSHSVDNDSQSEDSDSCFSFCLSLLILHFSSSSTRLWCVTSRWFSWRKIPARMKLRPDFDFLFKWVFVTAGNAWMYAMVLR